MMTRDRFATALLFVALACAACLIPAQSDTWWQLRTGEEMWRTGRIMLHDSFTHTVMGQPWPNHEWLAQVLFYAVYRMGGMPLLTAVCASAVVAAWVIVSDLTPGSTLVRIALLGAGAVFSSVAWSLRPQTLTLMFFAATLWILVRRRYLWSLPLLFLVWANLHGGVSLGGLLVVSALIATAIVSRRDLARLSVVAFLCLAATALTPLGTSLWFEVPRSFARLQSYDVIEWRAPSLTSVRDLPFWVFVGCTAVASYIRRSKLRTADALTLVVSSALLMLAASRSARNIPPFLLCAVPTLATLIEFPSSSSSPVVATETPRRSHIHVAALAAISTAMFLVIAFAWHEPSPRLGWHPVSEEMKQAIASCDGPLYNRYDEGGYLVWFMKDRKVFMDSRQDPFPEDLVLGHIRLERTGEYRATFDRFGITCALAERGSPLDRRLEADGWRPTDVGRWRVYARR
jgi:hypothetical protein